MYNIAAKATNLKNSLIAYGVCIYFFLHVAINLVGVMGLGPLTGVPLPFLSYGGSYIISLMISLALAQRVAIETNNEERLFTSFFDPNQTLVQIVNSGPTETTHEKIEDALITMINSAKKSIYIQTPYFTPTEQFLNALKLASFKGVKVNIMIPSQWDKFYMKAASYQFASEMSQHEINFYLYNGFIHAKTIVVDGKICSIGTTNIDNRSFSLHYEQNAIFYDRRISTKCIAIFNEDIKSSKYADSTYFKNKKLIVRATWSLFKLFSPFM